MCNLSFPSIKTFFATSFSLDASLFLIDHCVFCLSMLQQFYSTPLAFLTLSQLVPSFPNLDRWYSQGLFPPEIKSLLYLMFVEASWSNGGGGGMIRQWTFHFCFGGRNDSKTSSGLNFLQDSCFWMVLDKEHMDLSPNLSFEAGLSQFLNNHCCSGRVKWALNFLAQIH